MRLHFFGKRRANETLYKEFELKLFVGNLSWNTTAENLHIESDKCDNVVSAWVSIDGDT